MYTLDKDTGLFIPISETFIAVNNELSDNKSKDQIIKKLETKHDINDITFYYDWINKWKKIKPEKNHLNFYKYATPSDLKRYILKNGLLQMILCVTEDCNLRCKYCVYSDNYEYTRSHSEEKMDFKTAKKAIDYYFKLIKEGLKFNPLRRPGIGFYGGEPLLNFELIKICVEYIKKEYPTYETQFTITTNGTLLEESKSDWLMENEFTISISLDGPEKEHDRLRVYPDGKGSFNDVINNVQHITNKKYDKVNVLPVFDWKSDLFQMETFFSQKEIPQVSALSQVDSETKTKYYEDFTESDYNDFREKVDSIREYYFQNINTQKIEKESVFDHLVGFAPSKELFDTLTLINPDPIMPYTGACIPGRKIFVDITGNLHMCERVNDSFPIGNVNNGLEFDKIILLIQNYLQSMDKCSDCNVRWKCGFCFKQFMTNDGFLSSSKYCENIESNMKYSFINTLNIAERFHDFIEESNTKHKNLKKFLRD